MRFIFLIVILLIVKLVDSKGGSLSARRDRAWKAKKAECEEKDCGHMIIEESYNCVNKCTSPTCYQEIYAEHPLEDGEIDYDREREFITCMRREQMNIKVRVSTCCTWTTTVF